MTDDYYIEPDHSLEYGRHAAKCNDCEGFECSESVNLRPPSDYVGRHRHTEGVPDGPFVRSFGVFGWMRYESGYAKGEPV